MAANTSPQDEAIRILAETIRMVDEAKGVLLVPSFAIGRTQEVVWELDRLIERGEIPLLPLYLDSPMASKASDIYRRHPDYYDEETGRLLREGDTPLDYPNQIVTNDIKDSQAIERAPRPYMIVASNGMLTGGRVVGHLRHLIDDPTAVILFVGYQGEGTLGAHLQAGAQRGQARRPGPRRSAARSARSAASRRTPTRPSCSTGWAASGRASEPGDAGYPRRVFLVHGDPEAQVVLEPKVQDLGFATHVPHWHERVELTMPDVVSRALPGRGAEIGVIVRRLGLIRGYRPDARARTHSVNRAFLDVRARIRARVVAPDANPWPA